MFILLCTKSKSLLEHWKQSLVDTHSNLLNIDTEKDLLENLDENSNTVLLLDSNFFINIRDYLKALHENYSNAKIIFMDDCPTFKKGKGLLPFGIQGYANSRLSSVHLVQAVNFVSKGNIWLYQEFIQELIQEMSVKKYNNHASKLKSLTSKEQSIAKLVADGYSNKMIAINNKVTESTIKVHLHNIYRKLQLKDKLSLALYLK